MSCVCATEYDDIGLKLIQTVAELEEAISVCNLVFTTEPGVEARGIEATPEQFDIFLRVFTNVRSNG